MNKINVKKATGADGIPAKIVKASKSVIAPQLSTLINITVDTGVFPDRLKKAQVTPLFKKNDPLVISNYRPVSILPIFSKLFEKVIETQLNDFLIPFSVLTCVHFDEVMDVRLRYSDYWKTGEKP